MRTTVTKWLALTAIVLVIGFGIGGCDQEQIDLVKEQAKQLERDIPVARQTLEEMKVRLVEIEAELAEAPEGKTRDALLAAGQRAQRIIGRTQGSLDIAEPRLRELNERLAETNDPAEMAGATAQTISSFLPPPWNTLVGGIAGLSLGLYRAYQKDKTGKKVIASVAPFVKIPDDKKAEVRAAQGAAGNRMVDVAQGTKSGFPF